MKAIHNFSESFFCFFKYVKDSKMKAIHNLVAREILATLTVSDMSKILK